MKALGILPAIAGICLLLFSCSGNIDPDEGGNNDGGTTGRPDVVLPENFVSRYRQRMIAMQFTSAGCVNCPSLTDAVNSVRASRPEIIPVALHLDYDIDDPMSLQVCPMFYERVSHNESNIISLPMFALNFRRSSQRIVCESPKILSEMALQAEKYPVCSGVAIQTAYDEKSRKLSVTAKFVSEISQVCRYHILLVEDGIKYMQMGVESSDYIHDNVLRYLASDDMRGVRINSGNPLTPDQEYEVVKSIAIDSEWNPEAMRVIVVLLSEDDGNSQTYGCNNANECALGSSTGYQYKDDK